MKAQTEGSKTEFNSDPDSEVHCYMNSRDVIQWDRK